MKNKYRVTSRPAARVDSQIQQPLRSANREGRGFRAGHRLLAAKPMARDRLEAGFNREVSRRDGPGMAAPGAGNTTSPVLG